MIKVGFDARWYTTSGVGMYVANLLESMGNLEDDDFEIVVYEFADNPVPVVSKRIRKQIVKGGKYSLAGQLELARRCRIDRLDLFHAPFYIVPIAAPCPVVCTIHDLIAFLFPIYNPVHQSIVKLGYRVAVRKAHRIISVSDTTKRDLELILSVPPPKDNSYLQRLLSIDISRDCRTGRAGVSPTTLWHRRRICPDSKRRQLAD